MTRLVESSLIRNFVLGNILRRTPATRRRRASASRARARGSVKVNSLPKEGEWGDGAREKGMIFVRLIDVDVEESGLSC